ncbi:uncharacterized protein CG7065 isoform X2 [Musca domestica]|uniref:Uncharacterized protein CG7065 isoform X2 n=1 Tax=Musca domestica TaxID=7370 RepID=A0A9J7CTT6_MUSDO|nr:uncharacterized protein CG7065 isoform X2 [Musca domestica]
MDITPGEPVPPGFEEEVLKVPRIQSTIDQYKANALIGIEYTLELHECDRPEPGYLCVLCDKRGDGRTILHHWTSFNHRMKYLEKHYPSAVREFQPVKYKPNSHNILIAIIQNIAEAIEDFHGRLKVRAMDADEFRRQKTKHTETVISSFHHDERNGPNFLSAIDRSLIDGRGKLDGANNQQKGHKRGSPLEKPPPKRDEFDAISSDSDNNDSAKKPKFNSRAQYAGKPTTYGKDEQKDDKEKKLPTPKELSLQASHIAQERYKWEKYRCMLEIHLKQVEKLQKDYEKSPEKHPQYPEEWKKFWNRRYKELQAEKKVDPNKHDYKPEWIVFWTKRMKELFNAEVEKKKKEIKIKLGLPEDAEEKVDQLKERYKVTVNRVQRQPISDVIDISDDESPAGRRVRPRRTRSRSRSRSPRGRSPPRGRDYRYHSRSRSKSRSLSPFSDDYDHIKSRHMSKPHRSAGSRGYNPIDTSPDYYQYGGSSRYPPIPHVGSSHYPPAHVSSGPYRILDSSKIPKYEDTSTRDSKEDEQKEDDGPLSVVGVLRLLTALEEHLGSLGPKVVDLLGKALALEKVKANSSDDLLLNEDNCVFFETIKEKLKGLLIADVLVDDPHKVRAVKKAIKNIAGVIYQVTQGNTNEDAKEEKTKDSSLTIGGGGVGGSVGSVPALHKKKINAKVSIKDLPFDRQMVATKMAAALVMQGREDVSTDDMDKLIYFFLLMVKLSKSKRELDGKPLYSKNVLSELGLMQLINTPSSSASTLPGPIIDIGLLDADRASLRPSSIRSDFAKDVSVDKETPKNDANASTLESLTDSDLQTLLQNFKHLSSEEQHHLIAHLKKLESVDPERVEKLRKYVNTSDIASEPMPSTSKSSSDSLDDASAKDDKRQGRSPSHDIDERNRNSVNPNKFSLDDDDDDDYNFDEVFKAASRNINSATPEETSQHSMNDGKPKSANEHIVSLASQNDLTFNPAGLKDPLSDTQNLIANLMGSLQQSNSKSANILPQPVPPVGQKPQQPPQQQPPPPPPAQQSNNMSYYQQGAGGYPDMQQAGGYNQMPPNYYNPQMGYNQNPYAGGPGAAGYQQQQHQQWGPDAHQQIPGQPNMQFFGMPNYGGGYYGQGGN